MFVSGGFNDKNNVLPDTAILNLKKGKWSSVDLIGTTFKGLAFHTAVTVSSIVSDKSIYKFVDKNLKNFGIFIFGGIDSNQQPCNQLYRIVPGTRPLKSGILETVGTPPCARFLHTMAYSSASNNIIIFGGRVDTRQNKEYTCFNDVFVLFVDSLIWASCKVNGNIPSPRSGHSAAMMGTEFYVFGGVSNTAYCSSELYKLETNQNLVFDLIKSDERKNKKNLNNSIN